MADIIINRVTDSDLPAFREFCNAHWGSEHPLINNEAMFDYYYRQGVVINFLKAQDAASREIFGVCGFIPASSLPSPDVWVSFILTKKGGSAGLSFRLIDEIKNITRCATLSCNNIRKKVFGMYQFIGCDTFALSHYYRVNPELSEYSLCSVVSNEPLSLCVSDWEFTEIGREALQDLEIENICKARPVKDNRYFAHRYFDNPFIRYRVFAACCGGVKRAVVVVRLIESEGVRVLRVVDYIGDPAQAWKAGQKLDGLMRYSGAEFCDWYAAGLNDRIMERGGFKRLSGDSGDVIPFYLDPPVMENIELYGASDGGQNYIMFRADGDQDRPNLG